MKKILKTSLIMNILCLLICSCTNKKHDLKWEGDKLIVEMPLPSKFRNQENWNGIDLNEVIKEIFNQIRSNSSTEYTNLIIRFSYNHTDKYGNESIMYKEKPIGRISTNEVKKYKSSAYFDSNYHIRYNIEGVAFNYTPLIIKNDKQTGTSPAKRGARKN